MDITTEMPGGVKVWSLASGSKANCTLVCSENTRILVDFGVSCRYAKASLASIGIRFSDVDAVFITHEHSDHIAGLETFFKNYNVPVHMTEPSYLAYTYKKGFYYRNLITVHEELCFTERIGDFTVTSMPVLHDSAACVAYKLRHDGGVVVGICTDAGSPSDALCDFFSDCGYVITECNHDVVMLRVGSYPDELKRRILSQSGHTSNDDCAEFVVRLAKLGVRGVLLAHLSPENNTGELALYTVREALERSGATLDYLAVAPRYELFPVFGTK